MAADKVQKPPADAPSETAPAEAAQPEPAPAIEPAAERKFRVTHGAVSGVGRNMKGEPVPVDFYGPGPSNSVGAIVTESQLDGHAAQYLVLGAIEALD